MLNRKIYCFWVGHNNQEMNENRKSGLASLFLNSKVEVILVDNDNLHSYILEDYPLHEGFEYLSDVHKADYLRTYFMYHHGGGYIETPQEIDWLLEYTNPALVGLCFDTGHYRLGGGTDPLAALQKYYDRVWHVHFKDFNPGIAAASALHQWDYFGAVSNGVFCELGKGDVPFEAIKTFLESKGYDGWIVVEQDVLPGMGEPKLCAQHNREYLKSIGL